MTIGVVITNYNSWNIAINCVNAHLKYSGSHISKIVLVDDCSTDNYNGTIDPKVTVIRNKVNLGFVKSVNVGFKYIDTDIVLLFDADAAPLMDYADGVINEFSHAPKLGVVGFTTLDKSGEVTGSSEREPGVLSLIFGQKLYHRFQTMFANNKRIVVYSCTMAVRKKAFESVNGFDENFDWIDPDNDFCMSLRKKGWEVRLNSNLTAYHEGGGTPQIVSHRVMRFYKNRWYLLKKHKKIKSVFFVKLLILFRLEMELLFLKVFGKMVFQNPEVYLDKLNGRKKIIQYCRSNYH